MAKRKQSSMAAAIRVGEALAASALKARAAARKTRKAALARAGIRVAPRTLQARIRLAGTPVATATSRGVIVAEGDSWFDYPFHDILSDLDDSYGFDVESVAHHGDTVEDMAYSGSQLQDFSRRVEKVLDSGVPPRAILLSGGGNDVAGDEFAILLNHAKSNIRGLNESIVSGVIDVRARNSYITILSAIDAICRAHLGRSVPTIVHGYAYPVPDGRGFWGGGWILPGPWLEPGFRAKGYDNMAERIAICKGLLDRFNKMLADLSGKPPFAHVKYLDLRPVLTNGPGYKKDWDNELHPTKKGFEKVTAKFAAAV